MLFVWYTVASSLKVEIIEYINKNWHEERNNLWKSLLRMNDVIEESN